MALQLKNAKGQLASTAAVILDVAVGQTWVIQNITIHNGDAADQPNIKFYILPDAGSVGASNIFIDIPSLLAGETRQINLKHNLESQDRLFAVADNATKVNYVVSYAVRTD